MVNRIDGHAGDNDANVKGTGSYEAIFNLCTLANLSWLAIPASYEMYSTAATATGTWVTDAFPQGGIGRTSTTNGSTLTYSLTTTGGTIYIWYKAFDSNAGTFTYNIDGSGAVAIKCLHITSDCHPERRYVRFSRAAGHRNCGGNA